MAIDLPYGHGIISITLSCKPGHVDIILPNDRIKPVNDPKAAINHALSHPISSLSPFASINGHSRIAITINDKTRPVPNAVLLPPLLARLESLGVRSENISIFVASGTHIPMVAGEYGRVLGDELARKYPIIVHNCDDLTKLCAIGNTSRGTPIFVNSDFFQNDLKIVVGDIEPHHFAGYSGGVKSAAIGLAGRATINANHMLLLDEQSNIGSYEQNPLRQDIEEIGNMMKVDLALNAVLNEKKEFLGVFFGQPLAVMKAGIQLVDQVSRVRINRPYDLVIASAGGYPRDINLYQAQKAMTHASLFCRSGGKIVLVAECEEGIGSDGYLEFMQGLHTVCEVIDKFKASEFRVGPHKAFQIARVLQKHEVLLYSALPSALVTSLLLKPVDRMETLQELFFRNLDARLAILPYATSCIASLEKEIAD